MKTISIVIPNYNGEKLLESHLPNVLKYSQSAEIIVVDDASTDGSIFLLEKKFPQVHLIKHQQNLGFPMTVNDGFQAASGDFIFLLNSDAYFQNEILEKLSRHFDDPSLFGVGCLQKTNIGDEIVEEGSGIGFFEKGFFLHRKGDVRSNKTLWVFGGAGMFRKNIWTKLGGLCPLYSPFYWEDVDISYRALKSGFSIRFDPECVIFHDQNKSIIRTVYSPFQVNCIVYRNQYLFVWLNISNRKLLFEHILFLPIHLLKSLMRRNRAHLAGFIEAIKKLPEVVESRKLLSKLWKIDDQKILEIFKS
ncbi:glycosyltransferase family 2 protein [Candidatus Gottesmanbacteria bacterium]|nr:glycosyltransferase family 2 protein [Candidatus Gottesmanbacteria bacterium]